jgi:CheY-like chemotaxis protein
MVKEQFKSLSYIEIFEAENHSQALNVLENQPNIKVVFLDINMPDVSGLITLETIRLNPALSDLKIIMVTTESQKRHIMRAMRLGAVGYLSKPFNTESFQSVREIIESVAKDENTES